jgi:hypothetical protein
MAPDPIALPQLRGFNGWDDLVTGPDNLAVELLNIDLYNGGLGQKRAGVGHVGTSATDFGGGQWNDQTIGPDYAVLARTQPGQVASGSVLLIFGASSKVYSIYNAGAGSTAAVTTLTLAPASDLARSKTSTATINSKVMVAVDTAENRTQVLESLGTASPTCRRAGLKAAAAATVAGTGVGTYAQTVRYYEIQWRRISGGVVKNRSALGAAVAYTPATGLTLAARITRPTAPGEGETHWVVYASADGAAYYQLSGEILLATTTYDDSTAPSAYSAGEAAPLEGSNIPFPSCKFLLTAFNRLIGFGRYETTAGDSLLTNDGIVYHSPARGETDDDVEEVINNTAEEAGFLPLDENASGLDRALVGPMQNVIYALKDRGIWGVVPTDAVSAPFKSVCYTRDFGAVNNDSTKIAEDETGNPALYFVDPRDGVRRLGQNGIEWLGKDLATVWERFNGGAGVKAAASLYVQPRKQLWFAFAMDDESRPVEIFVYDVTNGMRDKDGALRGGWSHYTGFLAGGDPASGLMSAVMFPHDLEDLTSSEVPYLMINGSLNNTLEVGPLVVDNLYRVDFDSIGAETVANNAGVQGLIETKAYGADAFNARVEKVWILADADPGVELYVDVIGNTGEGESVRKQGRVDLTPVEDEVHVLRPVEDIDLSGLWAWQLRIRDVVETDRRWNIHRVYVSTQRQERRN